MVHPLVTQLRFARSEWLRALGDVSAEDAVRRCGSMNSISWIIGHLTWQENRYWLIRAQGTNVAPYLDALTGYGAPPSTPPLDEMWAAWRTVTAATDPFLDSLTTETLQAPVVIDGQPRDFSLGSMMLRTTYHYWFHIGETQAIRQVLGHTSLPDFVGDIESEAPYRPEA
ncbi:MAG: DinB family protein [Dehalococcoidia bacterium]